MEHSVVKQLKTTLLNTVLDQDPEASVELFAMAAMHGDIDTLDMIISKVGDKLGNLEEMNYVRDALSKLIEQIDAEEARQKTAEAAAAFDVRQSLD